MRGLSLESAKDVLEVLLCSSSMADNSDDGSVLVLVLIVKIGEVNFFSISFLLPVCGVLTTGHNNILSIGNPVS